MTVTAKTAKLAAIIIEDIDGDTASFRPYTDDDGRPFTILDVGGEEVYISKADMPELIKLLIVVRDQGWAS